jgi:hypothetical protein
MSATAQVRVVIQVIIFDATPIPWLLRVTANAVVAPDAPVMRTLARFFCAKLVALAIGRDIRKTEAEQEKQQQRVHVGEERKNNTAFLFLLRLHSMQT